MRISLVLLIFEFFVVRGDTRHRIGTLEPQPEVKGRGLDGTQGLSGSGAISSNICGYLGGVISQPWLCQVENFSCVVESSQGVIGCCYSNSCGAFRTNCIAKTDPCDTACMNNGQNLICDGAFSLCATYTYPNQVSEVRCVDTPPAQLNVEYTYTGFSTPITLPRYIAGYTLASPAFTYQSVVLATQMPTSSSAVPSSTAISTLVTSNMASSGSLSSSPSALSTIASSSTSFDSISNSSVPAGAITGGVVGGLAVVAAFAAFVLWFRYQKSQAQANISSQTFNPPTASVYIPPSELSISNHTKDKYNSSSMITEDFTIPEIGTFSVRDYPTPELPGEMRWR